MLPTKGYFQDIECPYYDNNCNRPYCHFRHRKKTQELIEENIIEEVTEPEIPTYKPTPKSELVNIKSHIPISYVPDLAFRSDRTSRPIRKFSFEKPTYKPTPLSILSSANKRENTLSDDERNDDIATIREIQQNIANVEYNPTEVSVQEDINFEDLSAEFDMIDDIIDKPKPETRENNGIKQVEDIVRVIDKPNEKSKRTEDKKKNNEKRESNSSSSSNRSHKTKHQREDTKDKSSNASKSSHSKTKHKKSDKDKDRHSGHRSKQKSSSTSSRKKEDKKSDKEDKKLDKEEKKSEKDEKKSHKSSKDRNKEKSKKHKSSSDEKSSRTKSTESRHSNEDSGAFVQDDVNNFSDIDLGDYDDDDDDTLSECYKIFQEYEPPQKEEKEPVQIIEQLDEISDDNFASKKRVAHSSMYTSEIGSKINYIKPKTQITTGEMLNNRFKIARLAQANNEQKNILEEVRKPAIKRPPPSLLEAAKNYKLQKMSQKKNIETCNVIDSIINTSKSNKPMKIAPVQNVNSIQRAKARIEELARQKAEETLQKTPAQTQKGAKRVAHVPDFSLSDLPDVLNADKSKLPINVRTRFLTMIADECVKLYLSREDGYNRALNEEFSCYEKCKVLTTYKNSAMLAVNRLRKETQEREKMGLGPIGEGESSQKDTSSNFKGKTFYKNISNYILTNEELDIHGFPKESEIPGRATIKNRRDKVSITLPDNQRKCSRCSKVYLVDSDGFVMYQEECIYHPLKKRTLRGEQTYLCCKTNDGIGCVTSNTHVSDMAHESELSGYQTTMEPEFEDDFRSYAVYALDCEMCYTVKGLELTRVTMVDSDCKTVYESLVKPLNAIIDYNTSFSGITKEQMERTSTSILQVQANILHLCNSKTILIGHSLESDMKALKIIHGTIVDTSVLFPHKMGLPHKRALKTLASEYLKKIIQNNICGHDSAEDAISCMNLVKWKVSEDLKVRGLK